MLTSLPLNPHPTPRPSSFPAVQFDLCGVLVASNAQKSLDAMWHAYRECSSSSSCTETPPNTNFVHSLPHNLEKLETRLPLFCAELHIDAVFQEAL